MKSAPATLAKAFLSIFVSMTAAYADCDDRPGTPTDLVATVNGDRIDLSFRNTTRGGPIYWDIEVRDGTGNNLGGPAGTGGAPAGYGESVGLTKLFSTSRFQPGATVCFRVRARTEAGTEGCVSLIWGNTSCVTIPDPAVSSFCSTYADDAFNQHGTLQSRRMGGACAPNGPRWSPDRNHHYNWCMSVRGQPQSASWPDIERNARNNTINSCKPTTASGFVPAPPPAKPPEPPPPPPVCSVNALVTVDQCYNLDGTPSQYYPPGSTQVSGCGQSEEEAVNAAKASLGIRLEDDPAPGSCTFSKQTFGGTCSCSPLRNARFATRPPFKLPKASCAGDLKQNSAGRCACAAGTTQRGIRCVANSGNGGTQQSSAPGGGGGAAPQSEAPGGGSGGTEQADAGGAVDPHAGLCPPGEWGTPPDCKKGTGGTNMVYPNECPPGSTGEPPYCQLTASAPPAQQAGQTNVCPPGSFGTPPF